MMMRTMLLWLAALLLSACGTGPGITNIPAGENAYTVIPATTTVEAADYRIGPLDTLEVTVFQEPELSVKAAQVDASGRIAMPLVGAVDAKGKTAPELSKEIAGLFSRRYLRDPQVTVSVASSVSQKVAVQGEVTEPGVYALKGPATLLEVLSLAKGETETAALNEVVVFRTIDGKRMGAVFDVASIRRGQANDPQILGNDLVVVGFSSAKRFWQNIVRTAPLLNVFRMITGF